MIAILLFSMAAQATPAPENPPIVVEGERPKQEKKVCRTERETGSRMVKRICRTPSEQRQAELQDRSKIRLGTASTQPTEAFKRPRGD